MANTGALIITDDGSAAYYKHNCKFNENVDCAPFHRHCDRCGWNPAVAQTRLKKICNQKGLTMPKREE